MDRNIIRYIFANRVRVEFFSILFEFSSVVMNV